MQQADDGFDLQIMARAEPDNSDDCAVALAGVAKVTLKTANAVSPGTDTQLLYLSPSQVSKGQQLTATYSGEEVVQHFLQRKMLMHGNVVDYPKDILPVVRATQVSLQS